MEAFGRWLGHHGGILMNGISACVKGILDRTLAFFLPHEYTTRSWPSVAWKIALARTWPCWHPDLRFPASRAVENKFLLVISHLVYVLYYQPERRYHLLLIFQFCSMWSILFISPLLLWNYSWPLGLQWFLPSLSQPTWRIQLVGLTSLCC